MKQQVVLIGGGETFATHDDFLEYLRTVDFDPYEERGSIWKDTFVDDLGKDFDVLIPSMPNKLNAKYQEWSIWFERLVPFVRSDAVFVGWSLGGIFLAKYLAENTLPTSIASLHLLAAPFDDAASEYSLADFVLPDSLTALSEQCDAIHLYHSHDDPVVAFDELSQYQKALPKAHTHIFDDMNHFIVESLPELVANIRKGYYT
jgi:predicted alpha/beta hydrolase family esterase